MALTEQVSGEISKINEMQSHSGGFLYGSFFFTFPLCEPTNAEKIYETM